MSLKENPKEVDRKANDSKSDTEDGFSALADNATGLNIKSLHCKRCGSKIVKEFVASLLVAHDRNISLPSMHKKNEGSNVKEEVETFWVLRSPMEFENVGFTNTVDKIKYLCCADCEVGPVGLAMTEKTNEFLVAANRVDYR